jgi:hypothetical protein
VISHEDLVYLQSVAAPLLRQADATRARALLLELIAEHRDLSDAVREHYDASRQGYGFGPVNRRLWQKADLAADLHPVS